jgi:hypothetical protein
VCLQTNDWQLLPRMIANRLRHEADRIERGAVQ